MSMFFNQNERKRLHKNRVLGKEISAGFNDGLSDYLTAYRKRHSCETALMLQTKSWRLAVDKKECVGLVSTDISKAFNCMQHLPLGAKL